MLETKARGRWMIPVALVAALALAASLHAGTAPDTASAWRVVAASGPVEALPPNAPADSDAWNAIRRGDEVRARAIVRTGKRGRTTLARADAVVVIAPDSRIELPSEAPRPGAVSSVVQTEGSVYYEIERREQPHFEVVTPYLVAGVKGTSFLVSVDERGATVGVDEGLVEVSDALDASTLDVGAGEFVSVGRDGERLERLDDDDRDDRRERRREARTMARLKDARDESNDGAADHDSEASRDDAVADAMSDDDVSDDDSSDDSSDDLIADGGHDDSHDDASRDDESLDHDVYTDDEPRGARGARDSSVVDPDDQGDDSIGDDEPIGDDDSVWEEDPERPGRGKPFRDDGQGQDEDI